MMLQMRISPCHQFEQQLHELLSNQDKNSGTFSKSKYNEKVTAIKNNDEKEMKNYELKFHNDGSKFLAYKKVNTGKEIIHHEQLFDKLLEYHIIDDEKKPGNKKHLGGKYSIILLVFVIFVDVKKKLFS